VCVYSVAAFFVVPAFLSLTTDFTFRPYFCEAANELPLIFVVRLFASAQFVHLILLCLNSFLKSSATQTSLLYISYSFFRSFPLFFFLPFLPPLFLFLLLRRGSSPLVNLVMPSQSSPFLLQVPPFFNKVFSLPVDLQLETEGSL